jgi:hypothetical protein
VKEAPACETLELADEAFGGVKVEVGARQQLSWLDCHGSRRRAQETALHIAINFCNRLLLALKLWVLISVVLNGL